MQGGGGYEEGGGAVLSVKHGRSLKIIDFRIPSIPGRSTLIPRRQGKHCGGRGG